MLCGSKHDIMYDKYKSDYNGVWRITEVDR